MAVRRLDPHFCTEMLRVGSYPHMLHGDNALGHLLMAVRDKFVFNDTMPVRDALQAREDGINSIRSRTDLLHDTVRDDAELLLQVPLSIISCATAALPRLQARDKGRHLNICVQKLPDDAIAWVSKHASPWRYFFAPQQQGRLSMLFVRLVPKSVRTERALCFPGQVVVSMPKCQDDDLAPEADWVVMDGDNKNATAQAVEEIRKNRRAVDVSSSFALAQFDDAAVNTLQPRRKRAKLTASV